MQTKISSLVNTSPTAIESVSEESVIFRECKKSILAA